MEHSRVDVIRVLAILREDKYQIEWDDCWDTLKLLDSSYKDSAPLFLKGLSAETSFARLYAMKALTQIGLSTSEITAAFLPLLKDEDYEVQLEALKWIGSHDHKTLEIQKALRAVLNAPSCAFYLKIKASWILFLGYRFGAIHA